MHAVLGPGNLPAFLFVDSSGRLQVAVSGAGSGGTSAIDESPFAPGVSAGTPIMIEDPTSGQLLIAQASPGTRQLAVQASVTVSPTVSSTASVPAQTVVGTTAAQVLAANSGRKRVILQNVGTTRIYIAYGANNPSTSVFHVALPAGGSTGDGSSPVLTDDMWQGVIRAISSASGGLLSITELT